jgi:predicted GNAT family acetyltransferase
MKVLQKENMFYVKSGNKTTYLKFTIKRNIMIIYKIFTPEEHKKKGIAKRLMSYTVRFAKSKRLKIYPACTYAEKFFKKNSQFKDSLAV